jgi:hypothetical protein
MKTLLPSLGRFVLSSRTPQEGVHRYKCQVLRRGAITNVFLCDYRRFLMNRSLFYLSHDPVNEHWVRSWVEERGGMFYPLSLRDRLPDGDCRLLLIDWDSLDSIGREEYLAGLLSHPGRRRIGLHSYYLADAETLRRKGVKVFERLEPEATAWLVDHDL